jgi:hypothetical protein
VGSPAGGWCRICGPGGAGPGFGRVRAARHRRGDQGRANRCVARRKLAEDRGIDQQVARHWSVDNMLAR